MHPDPTAYPLDADDVIDAAEARQLLGNPPEATWRRWHRDHVLAWWVAPGTSRRRYSRAWILAWLRSGGRGAAGGVR
jgi:hypothetical protein